MTNMLILRAIAFIVIIDYCNISVSAHEGEEHFDNDLRWLGTRVSPCELYYPRYCETHGRQPGFADDPTIRDGSGKRIEPKPPCQYHLNWQIHSKQPHKVEFTIGGTMNAMHRFKVLGNYKFAAVAGLGFSNASDSSSINSDSIINFVLGGTLHYGFLDGGYLDRGRMSLWRQNGTTSFQQSSRPLKNLHEVGGEFRYGTDIPVNNYRYVEYKFIAWFTLQTAESTDAVEDDDGAAGSNDLLLKDCPYFIIIPNANTMLFTNEPTIEHSRTPVVVGPICSTDCKVPKYKATKAMCSTAPTGRKLSRSSVKNCAEQCDSLNITGCNGFQYNAFTSDCVLMQNICSKKDEVNGTEKTHPFYIYSKFRPFNPNTCYSDGPFDERVSSQIYRCRSNNITKDLTFDLSTLIDRQHMDINLICSDHIFGSLPDALRDNRNVGKVLQRLILNECKLQRIPVYKYLSVLQFLELAGNQISRITKADFRFYTKLVVIDLRENSLKQIAAETFTYTNKLQVLTLSNNQISYIAPMVFGSTPLLQRLRIDHNNIVCLDQTSPFRELANLELLNIAANPLKRIEAQSFTGMPKITQIIFPKQKSPGQPILVSDDAFDDAARKAIANLRLKKIADPPLNRSLIEGEEGNYTEEYYQSARGSCAIESTNTSTILSSRANLRSYSSSSPSTTTLRLQATDDPRLLPNGGVTSPISAVVLMIPLLLLQPWCQLSPSICFITVVTTVE